MKEKNMKKELLKWDIEEWRGNGDRGKRVEEEVVEEGQSHDKKWQEYEIQWDHRTIDDSQDVFGDDMCISFISFSTSLAPCLSLRLYNYPLFVCLSICLSICLIHYKQISLSSLSLCLLFSPGWCAVAHSHIFNDRGQRLATPEGTKRKVKGSQG